MESPGHRGNQQNWELTWKGQVFIKRFDHCTLVPFSGELQIAFALFL